MEKYEDKSDFEINKAVVEALGYSLNDPDKYAPTFKRNHPNRVWFTRPNQAHSENKDYCNNPSDAWPIITENRIDTGWSFDDMWLATISNQGQPGAFMRIDHCDKNPLRAAMIVFLKMQEANNG